MCQGLIIFACGWGFPNLVQLLASTVCVSRVELRLHPFISSIFQGKQSNADKAMLTMNPPQVTESDQLVTLYAAFSFVDAIGGFIGPPAIALSYSSGILLGGIWSALPFLVVAAAYLLCGGGMLFLEATG